jgi:uncharacterized pyridoxamine 5'-phosphate oxidase family protein
MNQNTSSVTQLLSYLRKSGVFYLATAEGDQPRVRPFSAVAEYDGRLYMETGNQKKCYGQMLENPKVELSAMGEDGSWIRITACVVQDSRREARQNMIEANPGLSKLYSVDDRIMEVLYLDNVNAAVYNGRGVLWSATF